MPASGIMYAYYRGYANRKDEIGHSGDGDFIRVPTLQLRMIMMWQHV